MKCDGPEPDFIWYRNLRTIVANIVSIKPFREIQLTFELSMTMRQINEGIDPTN